MCLCLKLRLATEDSAKTFKLKGRKESAKVLRVIDGDTVVLAIIFEDSIFKVNARLNGINAYEIHDKDIVKRTHAERAKEYLTSLIQGKIVTVNFIKNEHYGRDLVEITRNGKSINEEMIKQGLAFPYDGKGKVKDLF